MQVLENKTVAPTEPTINRRPGGATTTPSSAKTTEIIVIAQLVIAAVIVVVAIIHLYSNGDGSILCLRRRVAPCLASGRFVCGFIGVFVSFYSVAADGAPKV